MDVIKRSRNVVLVDFKKYIRISKKEQMIADERRIGGKKVCRKVMLKKQKCIILHERDSFGKIIL